MFNHFLNSSPKRNETKEEEEEERALWDYQYNCVVVIGMRMHK